MVNTDWTSHNAAWDIQYVHIVWRMYEHSIMQESLISEIDLRKKSTDEHNFGLHTQKRLLLPTHHTICYMYCICRSLRTQ